MHPTQYRYMYRTTAGQFATYDPAAPPPANLATTTTDQGITVPYIVRIERGTMNRGIHEIAVLFDPNAPWTPWARQPQWNQKVLMLYGAGTSQVYAQSTPGSVLSNEPLSRGFAVATSSMMINSLHANFVTAAETTMMLKERIIETLGEIRYTIGEGASGGALLQHLTADSYPGLLNGLRITSAQDWEESISGAYREFADSGALVHAFTTSSLTYTNQDRAAIGGWGAANTNVFNIETGRLPDYNQPDDGTNCAGADSYKAATNPTGVRCTFQDFMVSILGRRAQDGYANLVWDNVGVQYGLTALQSGLITVDKFVDVNVQGGRLRREWRLAAATKRDGPGGRGAPAPNRPGDLRPPIGQGGRDRDAEHQQQRLSLPVPHLRQPVQADRRQRPRRQPCVLDGVAVERQHARSRWIVGSPRSKRTKARTRSK